MSVYITGDTHAGFSRVRQLCRENNTTTEDTLIILGDVGINYFLDHRDRNLKRTLAKLPITLFCIRGNHEMRPEHLENKQYELFFGNRVIVEEEYPNIKYALDGYDYYINDFHCMVIGGAYSVDKEYRQMMGWTWFEDEQLNEKEWSDIKDYLKYLNMNPETKVDLILSHTCPYEMMPTDLFIGGVDQSKVDKTTEIMLSSLKNDTYFHGNFYFGHYHDNRFIGDSVMLFDEIRDFERGK